MVLRVLGVLALTFFLLVIGAFLVFLLWGTMVFAFMLGTREMFGLRPEAAWLQMVFAIVVIAGLILGTPYDDQIASKRRASMSIALAIGVGLTPALGGSIGWLLTGCLMVAYATTYGTGIFIGVLWRRSHAWRCGMRWWRWCAEVGYWVLRIANYIVRFIILFSIFIGMASIAIEFAEQPSMMLFLLIQGFVAMAGGIAGGTFAGEIGELLLPGTVVAGLAGGFLMAGLTPEAAAVICSSVLVVSAITMQSHDFSRRIFEEEVQ